MSNRLSEDAIRVAWDGGHQSLKWQPNKNTASLLPTVDFKALLNAKDPAAAVQAVDRRAMYTALVTAGPESALEIMPLLSKEQFVAIIDYEGWHEDQLMIHQVIRWLDIYKHLGVDQMFKRFRELDEEYQVALLSPYMELMDEEAFETLGHDVQDQFQPLPCNTLWYRVKGSDQKVEEFVDSLIQGGLGDDVAYIYSLLSHAAYMPPQEQEDLMRQFRNARLEEDGFASLADSRAVFMPFDWQRIFERCSHGGPFHGLTVQWAGPGLFLEAVMNDLVTSGKMDYESIDQLKRSFAQLANMLAAACHIAADDVQSLTRILDQSRHMVSLGLEILACGNVLRGGEILIQERPKTVFQFANSVVNTVRGDALDAIRLNDWPAYADLAKYHDTQRFGALLWTLDTKLLEVAGFETVEMLKGVFNRFPMIAEEVVRSDRENRVVFRPIGTAADLRSVAESIAAMRTGGRGALEPVTGSVDALQ